MRNEMFLKWFRLLLLLPLSVSAKNSYTHMGERAYAGANYDRAMEYFQKALEEGETRGEPHFFMGNILESRRQFKESASYFAAAVERPMDKTYTKAALWKLVLYFHNTKSYELALKYIERLNRMGVHNKKFDEIRAEAETYLTPEKRQAREYYRQALEKEEKLGLAEFGTKSAKDPFWKIHKEEISAIISLYRKAADSDSSFSAYYPAIAVYAEKTGDIPLAIRLYSAALQDNPSGRVHYRLGVLQKKAGDLQAARENFLKTVALKDKEGEDQSAMFRYFLTINLAQTSYGTGDMKEALRFGAQSLEIGAKLPAKNRQKIAVLVYCNSLAPVSALNEEKIEELKNAFPDVCKNVMLGSGSAVSGEEGRLSSLLKAKLHHYRAIAATAGGTGTEKKMEPPEPYYALVYLPKDEQEIWTLAEIREVSRYFFRRRKFQPLYELLSAYPDIFPESDATSAGWKLESSWQTGHHREALKMLQNKSRLESAEVRMLLACHANLGQWDDLKKAAESFVREKPGERNDLIRTFQTDTQFAAFRARADFEPFLENLRAIQPAGVNKPD